MTAFYDLQTCRPAGMSLGSIPWTAINEYARAKGIEDAERFERLIRAMDAAFLETHYAERKGAKGAGTGSPPRD